MEMNTHQRLDSRRLIGDAIHSSACPVSCIPWRSFGGSHVEGPDPCTWSGLMTSQMNGPSLRPFMLGHNNTGEVQPNPFHND